MDFIRRYYKLMAMDSGKRSAQDSATAFRCVAIAFMQERQEACATAGLLSFADVVLLGSLWYATGEDGDQVVWPVVAR